MKTVNVIEFADDTILQLLAFEDTIDGNRDAEIRFHDIVKENYPDTLEEEIEDALMDGVFVKGNWQVFLCHSSN